MSTDLFHLKLPKEITKCSNGSLAAVKDEHESQKSESATVQTESRKEWWSHKNKDMTETSSTEAPGSKNGGERIVKDMEVDEDEGSGGENQRTKLRNRQTIAKPDSLKYEHDLNRGVHSKIMQNLFIDTRRKSRKQAQNASPPGKRTAAADANSEEEAVKKVKALPETVEVFDSYAFSLNLINGFVDTSRPVAAEDSKNKYVLYISNLPEDVTKEQLEEHFRKTGGIKSISIPRERGADRNHSIAYMEFDGRISHGIALRLHETTLGGKKINVGFAPHSVGKSESRKEKGKRKTPRRKRIR